MEEGEMDLVTGVVGKGKHKEYSLQEKYYRLLPQ
jgi:hypothetical protein